MGEYPPPFPYYYDSHHQAGQPYHQGAPPYHHAMRPYVQAGQPPSLDGTTMSTHPHISNELLRMNVFEDHSNTITNRYDNNGPNNDGHLWSHDPLAPHEAPMNAQAIPQPTQDTFVDPNSLSLQSPSKDDVFDQFFKQTVFFDNEDDLDGSAATGVQDLAPAAGAGLPTEYQGGLMEATEQNMPLLDLQHIDPRLLREPSSQENPRPDQSHSAQPHPDAFLQAPYRLQQHQTPEIRHAASPFESNASGYANTPKRQLNRLDRQMQHANLAQSPVVGGFPRTPNNFDGQTPLPFQQPQVSGGTPLSTSQPSKRYRPLLPRQLEFAGAAHPSTPAPFNRQMAMAQRQPPPMRGVPPGTPASFPWQNAILPPRPESIGGVQPGAPFPLGEPMGLPPQQLQVVAGSHPATTAPFNGQMALPPQQSQVGGTGQGGGGGAGQLDRGMALPPRQSQVIREERLGTPASFTGHIALPPRQPDVLEGGNQAASGQFDGQLGLAPNSEMQFSHHAPGNLEARATGQTPFTEAPQKAKESHDAIEGEPPDLGSKNGTDAKSAKVPAKSTKCACCNRNALARSHLCTRHQRMYDRENAPTAFIPYLPAISSEYAINMMFPRWPALDPLDPIMNLLPDLNAEEVHVQRLIMAANTAVELGDPETESFVQKQQRNYNGKALFEKKPGDRYALDMINARFRLLYTTVVAFHTAGLPVYPMGGDSGGYPKQKVQLNFQERLARITEILRDHKLIVMNVIEGRGVNAFVANPDAYLTRKNQNKQSNNRKCNALTRDKLREEATSEPDEMEGETDAESVAGPETEAQLPASPSARTRRGRAAQPTAGTKRKRQADTAAAKLRKARKPAKGKGRAVKAVDEAEPAELDVLEQFPVIDEHLPGQTHFPGMIHDNNPHEYPSEELPAPTW